MIRSTTSTRPSRRWIVDGEIETECHDLSFHSLKFHDCEFHEDRLREIPATDLGVMAAAENGCVSSRQQRDYAALDANRFQPFGDAFVAFSPVYCVYSSLISVKFNENDSVGRTPGDAEWW